MVNGDILCLAVTGTAGNSKNKSYKGPMCAVFFLIVEKEPRIMLSSLTPITVL